MIGGGFSLFGFDVFGLSRRTSPKAAPQVAERQAQDKARDERDAQSDSDREHSETFFWGMYPVY